MSVLFSISTTEVLELCRLDTGDSGNIADANRFLGSGKFQEALEQRLDAAARNTGLLDVKMGLTRLVAAEVLAIRQREDPSTLASLQVAGATLGKAPELAAQLRAEGEALLSRWWAVSAAAITPDTDSPANGAAQERLFGPSESSRVSGA